MIQFYLYFKFILLTANTAYHSPQAPVKISPQELSTWQTLDKGKISIEGDALIMEETPGADGFFLISPEKYTGSYTISYKVKAMSASSVLITLFSVSQEGNPAQLVLPSPDSSPREFWDWRSSMPHYNLTFNNSSHGITPFFFKNLSPSSKGFHERLPNNIAQVGQWHDVEIGINDSHVWFKMDGKEFFKVADNAPLASGHLIFRISGTTGEKVILAKAAIKDLEISFDN